MIITITEGASHFNHWRSLADRFAPSRHVGLTTAERSHPSVQHEVAEAETLRVDRSTRHSTPSLSTADDQRLVTVPTCSHRSNTLTSKLPSIVDRGPTNHVCISSCVNVVCNSMQQNHSLYQPCYKCK